jgi:RNA polymerase sigma-70 factor (sigma-E family)
MTGVEMTAPAGFEEFVEESSTTLLRAAWLLTGDWSAAEDLVQTALAAVWPRWDSLPERAVAYAYVRRCMMSAFLRERRRKRSGEIPLELGDFHLGYRDSDEAADIDMRQSLRTAMASLPARQRAVVVLRYFVDLTEQDTAAALGCSVGAVKSHASRALARLRGVPGLQESLMGGGT